MIKKYGDKTALKKVGHRTEFSRFLWNSNFKHIWAGTCNLLEIRLYLRKTKFQTIQIHACLVKTFGYYWKMYIIPDGSIKKSGSGLPKKIMSQ